MLKKALEILEGPAVSREFLSGRGGASIGDIVELLDDPYGIDKSPSSLGLGLVVELFKSGEEYPGWGPAWRVLMSDGAVRVFWDFNTIKQSSPRGEEANCEAR